jgi:colanic acid biosynthesis glycosyl transferase WcaI
MENLKTDKITLQLLDKNSATPRFKNWLIVTQYYHPEPGAPQIRLRAMAKELLAHQCNVTVLTGMPNYPEGIIHKQYKGKFTYTEEIDGVKVKRLWLYPAGGKKPLKRIFNYLTFTFHTLFHLGAAKGKQIVFIEAQPITLAFFGLFAKWLFKVPYIYNTPDLQVEIASERGWVGGNLVKAAKALETYFMQKSLSVSTVTHAFIEHFIKERKMPRERMSFLPNGVDLSHMHPMQYDHDYALKMGIAGKKVFTYAGTHADYQGLDVILDAAKLLKERNDISFLMVGKGPERQRLINRAAKEGIENVHFKDSPFSEGSLLMSISYAFLVVLRNIPAAQKMRLSKTFPPLACGVPVIFGGIGESADIIKDNNCGIVTPPEDPQMLANAVMDLADNPQKREEFSRNGLILIEREFSWKTIVSNWLMEIEKITPA